jgi:Tfp pilus assembly major pilin PilA
MLKILTIAVAGVLTAITLKRVYEQFQVQKARVRTAEAQRTPAVTRLRQDPSTGIYYPER